MTQENLCIENSLQQQGDVDKGLQKKKRNINKKENSKNKTNPKQTTCDFNIQESVFKE